MEISQSNFGRKCEHEKLEKGNAYSHDEHQRKFTPWPDVGSWRRHNGLERNYVNEGEHGGYMGSAWFTFSQTNGEDVWLDQNNEFDSEGGEQEHNDFTNVAGHAWNLVHHYGWEKYGTDNVRIHGLERLGPKTTFHGPQSNREHSSL